VTTARLLGVALTVTALAVAACGSDSSEDQKTASTPTTRTQTQASAPTLVGRWERMQTCRELAHALEQAHLRDLAPAVLTDFFPDVSASRIARKPDPCSGAVARPHSHFFTKSGEFGSVDDQNERVDDGSYRASGGTLRIGEGRFTYRIHGNILTLQPGISAADRRRAHAHPMKFSTAGWQVAVSYMGLPWKRVSCDAWC
jgi:hypothetical protein